MYAKMYIIKGILSNVRSKDFVDNLFRCDWQFEIKAYGLERGKRDA